MITPEIQASEGLSDAEVSHLENLIDEIDRSNPSMQVEIWKPKATIELDSKMGGQSLDSDLFSKSQMQELKRLGEKLFQNRKGKKTKQDKKAKQEIHDIIGMYVEYTKPDDLLELSVVAGGWMGHLTMPGYMDQTEPTRYKSLKEAVESLHAEFADMDALDEDEA